MKTPIDVRAIASMLLPLLLVLILMMLLGGCSPKAGLGIESACSQWDTLTASRFDTLTTVEQIYMNNVKKEAFCDGVQA